MKAKYDYNMDEIEKEGVTTIEIYLEDATEQSGDFYFYFSPEGYYIEEVNESGKTNEDAIRYAKKKGYTLLLMEYRDEELTSSFCLHRASHYPGSSVTDLDMDLYHKYDISPY